MSSNTDKPARRAKTNFWLLLYRPGAFVQAYRWPLLWLAAGTTLDLLTTWNLMRQFGHEIETHPAIRIWAGIFGTSLPAIGLAKAAQFGCTVFVASLRRRWCIPLLLLAGTVYLLAAMSNYFMWL
jgi:hypothetical protein